MVRALMTARQRKCRVWAWCARGIQRLTALGLVALLVACAGPSAWLPGAAPRPTLAQERQRLAELFEGTPVVLALERDGSLRAEVPLRFCFDPARTVVKPPLAALLDRLARSPATRAGAWSVTAPGDPTSKGFALAAERTASVRDYLVGQGADPLRVAVAPTGSTGSTAFVVRVVVSAPAGAGASR